MAYDITKLTNLGQMKSALMRIHSEIALAKSVRHAITVNSANWTAVQGETDVFKYSNVLDTSNYHFYDVHLSADSTDTIGRMCANSSIRAKIENNQINLYCSGTKPSSNFVLEIIVSPTTTSGAGLTFDIGDDYNVRPSVTDALDNRVSTLESVATNSILIATNISIPVNSWISNDDLSYPYKVEIEMENVTADYYPVVQFADADTAEYTFSPNATTSMGKVVIYCASAPSRVITIPSIMCYKCIAVSASAISE